MPRIFRRETGLLQRMVLLAFFPSAFLIAGTSITPAAPSAATALVFDFSPCISENFWRTVREALARTGLSRFEERHPVLLLERKQVPRGAEFFDRVEITLHGDCSEGRDPLETKARGPLGWVNLVDGRIQPFVFVDCHQIARILQQELRGKTTAERQRILACAVSRVVVHELTHIATQDPGHERTGPQKAYLTRDDLISVTSDVTRSMRRTLDLSPRETAAESTRRSPVNSE